MCYQIVLIQKRSGPENQELVPMHQPSQRQWKARVFGQSLHLHSKSQTLNFFKNSDSGQNLHVKTETSTTSTRTVVEVLFDLPKFGPSIEDLQGYNHQVSKR